MLTGSLPHAYAASSESPRASPSAPDKGRCRHAGAPRGYSRRRAAAGVAGLRVSRGARGTGARRSGSPLLEPALVEAADERLSEADRVGEGLVVDVLRDVGRPVVVGWLLELGA